MFIKNYPRKFAPYFVSGVLGIFSSGAFAENYLGIQCITLSGDVNYASSGRIANVSELDWATVQCPLDIDSSDLYIDPIVTFEDLNPNAGEDLSCFTRARGKDYGFGSAKITSARVTTVDVDADGFTGVGAVDELTMPQIYLGVVGGSALVECDLPPAVGPGPNDRSKIYIVEVD